jgi:hypothetical protein
MQAILGRSCYELGSPLSALRMSHWGKHKQGGMVLVIITTLFGIAGKLLLKSAVFLCLRRWQVVLSDRVKIVS